MQEPNHPTQQQIQDVISLYMKAELQQALVQVNNLLREFPDSSILHNIQGATYAGLGQFEAAVESYNQALSISPGDASTYYNLAMACGASDDIDSAIKNFKEAINIAPDYALAYNGMGNAFKDKGELEQAIASYQQALNIEPGYAEVLNNLGIAQRDAGNLNDAVSSYSLALKHRPEYAEAYNNLGIALKDKAELSQASTSFKQALELRPDYTDAIWNLAGCAQDITEAETRVAQCLAVDPHYQDALIALCVIRYFKGDRTNFDALINSTLKDHPALRSLKWVSGLPSLPTLYFNRWAFYDDVIKRSVPGRPFYEFGVFTGESFAYLMKAFPQGFGFDTFEGLPEDWHNEKAGTYSSGGKVPRVAGGEFVVGKFADTLPRFFAVPRPVASVMNFDADLYLSTICALTNAKAVMDNQTILVFDEFIVNEHWEQDEYKALSEFCQANTCTFEVLAVSFFTKQVAVRLMGL